MTFEEYTLEKYPNLKSSYDNFMSNYKDPMFIEMGAIYTRTNGAGGWITPISFTLTKNKEKHYRFKDVDSERSTYTYHAPQMFEQLVKIKPGTGIEPDDSKEMRFITIKGKERYVWFNVWRSSMRGHLHLKFGYQEGEETYEIYSLIGKPTFCFSHKKNHSTTDFHKDLTMREAKKFMFGDADAKLHSLSIGEIFSQLTPII